MYMISFHMTIAPLLTTRHCSDVVWVRFCIRSVLYCYCWISWLVHCQHEYLIPHSRLRLAYRIGYGKRSRQQPCIFPKISV